MKMPKCQLLLAFSYLEVEKFSWSAELNTKKVFLTLGPDATLFAPACLSLYTGWIWIELEMSEDLSIYTPSTLFPYT